MALNIFPRTKPAAAAPATAPEPAPLPEPSAEALEEARKRTRRGSRGGRGRGRGAAGAPDGLAPAEDAAPESTQSEGEGELAPARARRAPRARTAAVAATETATAEPEAAAPEEAAPAARRAPRRRGSAEAPAPAETREARSAPQPESAPSPRPEPRPSTRAAAPAGGAGDTATILRAIEAQGRQIEQLVRAQEEAARRGGGVATGSARTARVGVFVDAANIELACDRLRARLDWTKVLKMLTQDRQLVRAVAYSPVHDDPGVSMETQRFAEPFLGRGFKVVTKALKRFADGSVKANVDIELCLDVISMLDRLDVVCIVSGDGDFQPLVEYAQRHGVRCEVVGVASSTAGQLKNAADEYIDLGARIRELRVQ